MVLFTGNRYNDRERILGLHDSAFPGRGRMWSLTPLHANHQVPVNDSWLESAEWKIGERSLYVNNTNLY